MLYAQRDEEKRQEYQQALETVDATGIVYVDESGFDDLPIREYGRCLKGKPLLGERSGLRFARTSIIAGLQGNTPIAPMVFKGYCNTEVVLAWVEKMLLPELKRGQTVVWDNASFHKSPKIAEAFEKAGVGLLFLPPYSPDLNPIEPFWGVVKAKVRRLKEEALHVVEALGKVFKSFIK
jgi:transposase